MNDPSPMTLEYLVDRYLDAQATPAERDALNTMLRDDAAARDRFVSLCIQARVLRESLTAAAEARNEAAAFKVQGGRVRDRALGVRRWAALAAMVTLAAIAWFVLQMDTAAPQSEIRMPQSPVAMLSDFSADAVFAGAEGPMNLGAELEPGLLRLASGTAQVMFKSGAVVDLMGPCEFRMIDDGLGELRRGTLNAHVVPRARGFTIATPGQVRIVDLGTRFNVRVDDPAGTTTVYVLEGLVRVEGPERSANLFAGEAARYDAAGRPLRLARTVIPLDPKRTYLHTVNETPEAPAPVDLAALGIEPGMTITLTPLGDYRGQKRNADTLESLAAVFSASAVLLDHAAPYRVRDALSCGAEGIQTPPAAALNAAGEHEPTDIPQDFDVPRRGLSVTVPAGARYLFFSARDSYYADNADPDDDYAVGIEIETPSPASPPGPRGADQPANHPTGEF